MKNYNLAYNTIGSNDYKVMERFLKNRKYLNQSVYTKNYAMRNFFNFFFKILIKGEKAGLHYINFRKHFLKNLVYPYAWLSVFFFAFRTVKKMIKN